MLKNNNWFDEAIIYHIYPIGFFGAEKSNDLHSEPQSRLRGLLDYIDYLVELGVNVVQFGPVFESLTHGYDTVDYFRIDRRLGTNQDFKIVVEELHLRGIKVIIDGVFNHVSREFFSFVDVRNKRDHSDYLNWHFINLGQNSRFNDRFGYDDWEGHPELVKLNLDNRAVRHHIQEVMTYWIEEVGIDGWRFDVAYMISQDFWRWVRQFCKALNPDCILVGEMIHGPYTNWVGPDMLDAGTGYQVHKSIWSAINDRNMHELKAILETSFHPSHGQLRNVPLMNFLGNHDTNRIASVVDQTNLIPAYLILFTLNGFPKIYYGDELAMEGVKTKTSDEEVRRPMPPLDRPHDPFAQDLLTNVKKFIKMRKNLPALSKGDLTVAFVDPLTIVYSRKTEGQQLLVIVTVEDKPTVKDIPLWNMGLDGKTLVDRLNEQERFQITGNRIESMVLYPKWGRVLEVVN